MDSNLNLDFESLSESSLDSGDECDDILDKFDEEELEVMDFSSNSSISNSEDNDTTSPSPSFGSTSEMSFSSESSQHSGDSSDSDSLSSSELDFSSDSDNESDDLNAPESFMLFYEQSLCSKILHQKRIWQKEFFALRKLEGACKIDFPRLMADIHEFQVYFRMKPETFFYILNHIEDDLMHESPFRECISPRDRLMVTLRFLSTGTHYQLLSSEFRIHNFTLGKIVYECCDAIWRCLQKKHMPKPTLEDHKRIAQEYWDICKFPNCIGSVDGKHIEIRCPAKSGALYYNYKGFYSIVLQGIADANCRFITVHIGGYGKQSDGGTFNASTVKSQIETGKYNVPEECFLPDTETLAPHVLLADDAYPLRNYLLKPFKGSNLAENQVYYNRRLSKARSKIECAFGYLASKFGCFGKKLLMSPKNAHKVIKAATLLQNIIIDLEGIGSFNSQEINNAKDVLKEAYNPPHEFVHCPNEASKTRQLFCEFLNSPNVKNIRFNSRRQ